MPTRLPLPRHRELGLLAVLAVTVLGLGWNIARDLRQASADVTRLYDRLSDGLELLSELQFHTQEVRRIILYALHTSDANLQLTYAEQSREADQRVQRLIDNAAALGGATRGSLERVDRTWRGYLVVRDEVIGFILERSLGEAVALDENQGTARFNDVRDAIADVKANFTAEAEGEVLDARTRSYRAVRRLGALVLTALIAAAVGLYLVQRRTTLEGLLRSEAHKGSILQAVPDPIISTDEEGRIIELNEAAERAFGFTRADVLGHPLAGAILPERLREHASQLLMPAGTSVPGRSARIQVSGVRRDGTEFPMELAAVTHTDGQMRISTVHITDISVRRDIEAQLRRARDAAEQADRAKSDFLATMSHELRTPLSGVIGVAELLRSEDLPAPQRELMRTLRSSAHLLMDVVSDVLDYSRVEAGLVVLSPSRFSIQACIENALDPVREAAARKGVDLGYVIAPDLPESLVADVVRVRQVLLNLLSNAVKFTDSGQIAVRASARRTAAHQATITLRVEDTGPGIPAHLQHKLFQRYSQIDESPAGSHEGAGLGLAISERLSTLLGGSLTVESIEGQGSTFTFTFEAELPADASVDPLQGSLAGMRVRLLGGTGIVGQQLRYLLTHWGARTYDVASQGEPCDAIVVDAEAHETRRYAGALSSLDDAGLSGVPVVVVTQRYLDASTRFGTRAVSVPKPVRAASLYDALCHAAGEHIEVSNVIPEPEVIRRSLAILLVEDNDANRRVLHMMLSELGFDADESTSGADAVERAARRNYDLILMDVQMANVDGLEATRRIRASHNPSRPRIIALTANAMGGDEARCLQAGMDGYLSKPIRLNALEAALQPLISGRV